MTAKTENYRPTYVIAGRLQRDYLLPAFGTPRLDVPGGSLLHAAGGLSLWLQGATAGGATKEVGLLSRAGEDYPHEWLREYNRRGWDTRGIRILPEALDLRHFQAELPGQPGEVQVNNPAAHFARLGLPFPKSLLGYQPQEPARDALKSIHAASPRPGDLPADYLEANAVHLGPLDYSTGCWLSSGFRDAAVTTLTLDPSPEYMTNQYLAEVRVLLGGLTAFFPSEQELRALFWGVTLDLWEMAEALGQSGCEFIIVKCGGHGALLYDSISKKKWEVPAYAARVADTTGAGDSFCGGFLAGYQRTYDPLQGVLQGLVSASLTIEGSGIFHILESLPGLATRRLESLAGLVRRM